MIKISDAITKYELTEIIRTLVSFIIVDGKKFVNENDKKEYISKYLFTLSTAMNGISSFVDMNKVARIIEEDISKHHLGDGQNAEKLTKSE